MSLQSWEFLTLFLPRSTTRRLDRTAAACPRRGARRERESLGDDEADEEEDGDVGSSLFVRSFKGRRNVQTCAKEVRFLFGDSCVATGGDDGALYLWETATGSPLARLRADRCVVNSIAPHRAGKG